MSIQWFFEQHGEQAGPVSSHRLRALVEQGSIRPDTLVWRTGMAEWAAAATVPGLFEPVDSPSDASGPRAVRSAAVASLGASAVRHERRAATVAAAGDGGGVSPATRLQASVGIAIAALPGEQVEDSIEAAKIDLGLLGMLLGHRMAVVLTDRRVVFVHQRLTSADFIILDLDKVQGVSKQSGFRTDVLAVAVMLAGTALATMVSMVMAAVLGSGPIAGAGWLPASICLGLAVLLLMLSRRKSLVIEAGSSRIVLPATRAMEDLLRVVNRMWSTIHRRVATNEPAAGE